MQEGEKDDLIESDNGLFGELFIADLDSAFSADIACCENCYDDFLKYWPLAYDADDACFQRNGIDLVHFYEYFSKRLIHQYTIDEFKMLVARERCPRCLEYLAPNGYIWPYELPFDPPEYFEENIEEISKLTTKSPFLVLNNDFAKKVLECITDLSADTMAQKIKFSYFRARSSRQLTKIDEKEFWMAPKSVVTEGRYNHAGEPMLYLGSDIETCYSELRNTMCFIAEIEIEKHIKLLDFTESYKSHKKHSDILDTLVYSSLMSAKNETDGWHKPEYKFSRFIADCAKNSNFDAIKYPSTRLTEKNHNLVILNGDLELADFGKINNYYIYDGKNNNQLIIKYGLTRK